MKSLLYFILFFSAYSSQAQKILFSDTTNKWQINIPFSGGGQCFYCKDEYHYAGTDSSGLYFLLTNSGSDSAWIREDTLAGKVYARVVNSKWVSTDTNEVLLYDYNLQPGDTFNMVAGINGNASYTAVLSGTDTIFVDNKPYRFFHFGIVSGSPATSYDVIEGIGSTEGPLHPYFPFLFEERRELYCISSNGTQPYIYPAPSIVTTFELTPIAIKEVDNDFHNTNTCALLAVSDMQRNDNLKVFPQPASDEVIIQFPDYLQTGTIAIFDVSGRKVFDTHFMDKKEFKIARPGIQGIYLLIVTSNKGIRVTNKLIFN